MMMIRNNKVRKFLAVLFLFVFLTNIFSPSISLALTSGPHQPDFTEYEEPGSIDMVNLLTGDFTYNIPTLDVPSPEGTFSLPLSYHSGVGLEQESSWVGLGFSLNAGAINRNTVGYPDDANGEHFDIHRLDPDVERGWRSSLGPFGNIGWNSNTGHNGTISLLDIVSVSYNNGGVMKDVSVLGVHANKKGVHVEPVETMNAVATIASFGSSNVATGASATASGFQTAAKQLAIQSAINTAVGVGLSAFANNGSGVNSLGYFPVSYKKKGFNYWYWIDATKSEWMYGTLNLGKMPVLSDVSHTPDDFYHNPRIKNADGVYVSAPTYTDVTQDGIGASSDMHMPWDGKSYYNDDFLGATSIAKDNFSVLGAGVSGLIEPYRLDVGTLAFPRNAIAKHEKIALKKFEDYKVRFKYQGALSNQYNYHAGKTTADAVPNENAPLYGINHSFEEFPENHSDKILLDFSDVTLKDQRKESNRNGLKDDRLALGRNIEWFTNSEILNESGNVFDAGYIDFLPASERQAFRSNLPQQGIGGFTVTREDGLAYHYTIPVYDRNSYTKVVQANDATKYTEIKRDSPFAHTWLLTAITGADFVDLENSNKGVLDDADLGYWVKFEYGKFSESYQYRMPYGKDEYLLDPEKKTKSFTQGERENYYLNFIKTRSHTAMFVKGLRKDCHGFYNYSGSALERAPSSSLYLDEIVLLTNEDFKSLNNGNSQLQPPLETVRNLISSGAADPYSGDSFDQVLDIYDINDTGFGGTRNLSATINDKAMRRVKFNYTYELCEKTPNSFDVVKQAPKPGENFKYKGKLTLESLSLYGKSNAKLSPDYGFEYESNPVYDKNNWDGWGFYNPSGSSANHAASANKTIGTEWSLTRIITPLGSEINVDYERDSYSSVSGVSSKIKLVGKTLNVATKTITFDVDAAGGIDLRDYLSNGQTIKFYSSAEQQCICWDISDVWTCEYDYNIPEDQTISGLTANSFVLSSVPGFVNEYNDQVKGREGCGLKSLNDSHILIEPASIAGGNIRVKTLSIHDEINNVYKTKYIYSNDETSNGITSGVVSQEPEYISKYDYGLGGGFDVPFTPVLYGKTTVLTGRLTTDNDFINKRVFEFRTPLKSDVSENRDVIYSERVNRQGIPISYDETLREINFEVDVNTSGIGQPLSIASYDNKGSLISKSMFQYTSELPGKQGLYTEGSILAEKLRGDTDPSEDQLIIWYHRIFRTTKRYHPSVLKGIVTIDNNTITASENKSWDFITGVVLEQDTKDCYGNIIRTTSLPAYYKYPGMGSKALDPANKNMLVQSASSSEYKIVDGVQSVLSSDVLTWKDNWATYRYFDEASDGYKEQTGPVAWRSHQSYIWNSPFTNPDGTLKNFSEYNWTSPAQDQYWQKSSEITRYDHFSMPVESVDLNGNYVSVKTGYDNKLVLASAENARYTEFAYSGAEDKVQFGNSIYHFGGEVRDADKQDATYHHSGNFSIKLLTGQKGFTYKGKIGDNGEAGTEIESNRKYRANVWIHKSDAGIAGGKLYAQAGTSILAITDLNQSVKQSGDWLLMSIIFDIPATQNGATLTVGCTNEGTSGVYFDDFRFQPLDAEVTANVYDPTTYHLTHVLDNDNLYTRFEYNNTGRPVKIYREVFSPTQNERLLSHTQYNFARMKIAQWADTGNKRCVTLSDGSNSGAQEKEQKDINLESATYNQVRWVSSGNNAQECATCSGLDKKFINSFCETGTRENLSSYQSGDSYVCVYRYNFSDGSTAGPFEENNDLPCNQ